MQLRVFLGLCACLLAAQGITADKRCHLRDHFECASLIEEMEDPAILRNKTTCEKLEPALQCVRDLWKACGIDCSNKPTPANMCHINLKFYSASYERLTFTKSCQVLWDMEECQNTNCIKGSQTSLIPDDFTDADIVTLENYQKCSHDKIDRYVKSRYEYDVPSTMTKKDCIELKLSRIYLIASLNPGTLHPCLASEVQRMSIDVIDAGVKHYLDTSPCPRLHDAPCSSMRCQFSFGTTVLGAILVFITRNVFRI